MEYWLGETLFYYVCMFSQFNHQQNLRVFILNSGSQTITCKKLTGYNQRNGSFRSAVEMLRSLWLGYWGGVQ